MSSGRSDDWQARLGVRILGSAEIILGGHRLGVFDSLRVQRFIGLLAVRREPQHRARVSCELWPESSDAQARTNLRKLLHELRRALPDFDDFIHVRDDTITLDPGGAVDVDLWRYRDAIAVGDLELAARIYRGDLLPACYDDWVLDERDHLRAEVHRILAQLAERAAAHDDHESTLRHGQRLIEHEPTDEVAARLMMEAHLALGDRAAALRVYRRCVETLGRELQVEPGDAVTAVYRTLRAGASRPIDGRYEDFAPIAESPFVGREGELATLREVWERARTGHAQLLVVSGEPGVGKSRLAVELGRGVRAEGHVVASARAFEAAGRLPWAPVIDLLRSDELSADVESLDPAWRTEIGRLIPEVADPNPPGGSMASGDLSQRYRLFEAIGRVLTGNRPRLLLIDDLQWCDADTLELIGYVIRAHSDVPLLVVGTVRPEEVGEEHPLDDVEVALRRDDAVTRIALEPLDESDTVALTAQLAKTETVDPEFAARIWRETEGNPLFVVESLRARLVDGDSQTILTPTMRSVLQGRLRRLADGPNRLAEIGAVIGRPFSVPLLAAITRQPEDQLVDDVDELWRRRIIVDRGATYDFSHDKLRAVALEAVSPARRRQLHRAVAEAIEAENLGADALAAQLAAHYDRAGMTEPAVDAYRRAGARAVAVSALDEAVAMFRQALTVLADMPPSPDRDARELDLRIALGSPLVALEGYGAKEVHRLYERARVLSGKLNRSVAPPILRGLGLARVQGCRFLEADEMSRALVDLEGQDAVAGTEGHYLLGVSAFWRGALSEARSHLEAALAGYDPARVGAHLTEYAQDPRAVCLVRLGWLELWEGDALRADEHAREALALAENLDHQMTSAYVGTYAAVIAAERGDLDRLSEVLDFLDAVWRRVPMPYLMILSDALRGWFEVNRGATEGIERIVRSAAVLRRDGETLHLTYCLLLLARARGRAGELREGRAAVAEALAHTRKWTQGYLEAEILRADGELAYRSGEMQDAADSLRRAVELADAQGANGLRLRAQDSLSSRFPASSV